MIAVLLDYKVPIEDIDRHRAAHLDWLRQGVADGRLLLAGRQVPVTGGMFLAQGTKEEVSAWAATDPFAVHDLADYRFIEVAPSVVAPGLEALAR